MVSNETITPFKKTQKKKITDEHPEYELRQIINEVRAAIDDRNVKKLMTFYAKDVVAFDIVPPLQYIGKKAYEKSWIEAFESSVSSQSGISEMHGLRITVSGDVAFAHSINHCLTLRKDGEKMDMWMRSTQCFEKLNNKWLITHEQFSVPVDYETQKALFNLKPETGLH